MPVKRDKYFICSNSRPARLAVLVLFLVVFGYFFLAHFILPKPYFLKIAPTNPKKPPFRRKPGVFRPTTYRYSIPFPGDFWRSPTPRTRPRLPGLGRFWHIALAGAP
jgi:hypothetical protein